MSSPLAFYDALADWYHLIFDDWHAAIERQARVLEPLLTARLGKKPLRILDCASGIGTQALGFAARGHQVTASDLSPAAVARLQREAATLGLTVQANVADMRTLAGISESSFDVIAALDNALPHLTAAQLGDALAAIKGHLGERGLFIASLRDYDILRQQRPAIQPPAFYGEPGSRRIVHQVWDWQSADTYTVHLYLTLEGESGWQVRHFASEYRCLLRSELTAALRAAQFGEIEWLMPETTGFYQPLVIAR